MMIKSDWHIHSEYSYDAKLPLSEIAEKAKEYGFINVGVTDHANYNDEQFLGDLDNSAKNVLEFRKKHPEMILGVELTPIEKPVFDYCAKHGTREGYTHPVCDKAFDIELAQTKEELIARGVRYAVGASHWRVDGPGSVANSDTPDGKIKEWYRQQLWLAQDERVTILGHPWYGGQGIWYEDFSVIPHSMNMDLAHALKENKKFVECNSGVIFSPLTSEKFRRQYAEFLRELFEMGIPVTYGSDAHGKYSDEHIITEELLRKAGFCDTDISDLTEDVLW